MSELITAELVDLDLYAETKEAAVRSLAERMAEAGRVTDLDGLLADVAAREAQMPTGLEGGIAVPHCRGEHVTEPTLAFGRGGNGIDFGAAVNRPAELIERVRTRRPVVRPPPPGPPRPDRTSPAARTSESATTPPRPARTSVPGCAAT